MPFVRVERFRPCRSVSQSATGAATAVSISRRPRFASRQSLPSSSGIGALGGRRLAAQCVLTGNAEEQNLGSSVARSGYSQIWLCHSDPGTEYVVYWRVGPSSIRCHHHHVSTTSARRMRDGCHRVGKLLPQFSAWMRIPVRKERVRHCGRPSSLPLSMCRSANLQPLGAQEHRRECSSARSFGSRTRTLPFS